MHGTAPSYRNSPSRTPWISHSTAIENSVIRQLQLTDASCKADLRKEFWRTEAPLCACMGSLMRFTSINRGKSSRFKGAPWLCAKGQKLKSVARLSKRHPSRHLKSPCSSMLAVFSTKDWKHELTKQQIGQTDTQRNKERKKERNKQTNRKTSKQASKQARTHARKQASTQANAQKIPECICCGFVWKNCWRRQC